MARRPNRKPYEGKIPFHPVTGDLQSFPSDVRRLRDKPDELTADEWCDPTSYTAATRIR